jgi:hypothetical protein
MFQRRKRTLPGPVGERTVSFKRSAEVTDGTVSTSIEETDSMEVSPLDKVIELLPDDSLEGCLPEDFGFAFNK